MSIRSTDSTNISNNSKPAKKVIGKRKFNWGMRNTNQTANYSGTKANFTLHNNIVTNLH